MHDPAYFSGTQVFPFDPDAAKRERYISLHQLIYWLKKSPYPKGIWPPHIALLGLAQRHIKAGRLKTYGVSSRTTFKAVTVPGEYIENGETRHAEIFDIRAESQEQVDNPLLDIFEFTDWFREVNPDYLSLPDNWPAPEVDQANRPALPSTRPAPPEPIEAFWFHAKQRNGYTDLCEELAMLLFRANGKNANATQAWAQLQSFPPEGYEIRWRPEDTKREMTLPGQNKVGFQQFKRFWDRWTIPTDSTD